MWGGGGGGLGGGGGEGVDSAVVNTQNYAMYHQRETINLKSNKHAVTKGRKGHSAHILSDLKKVV